MGGFASTAASVGMQVAQMEAQRQQAKAAAETQGQQVALQSQMLWQQQDQRAKQQRDLLKRQLATARASLAGGGIGFAGGSGQALMEGFARRTADEIADGDSATRLRHQLQFGTGGDDGKDLQRKLDAVQQGYSILRPFIS